MLKLIRRHEESYGDEGRFTGCEYHPKGAKYKQGKGRINKCSCPLWVSGTIDGKRHRYSLDTRNVEEAARKILEIEAGQREGERRITVADAAEKYLKNCTSRLAEGTVMRYSGVIALLVSFCASRSVALLRAIDCEFLTTFIENLHLGPRTIRTRIGDLRTFFNYARDIGWIQRSPAKGLKQPRKPMTQVQPFKPEEHDKILEASNILKDIPSLFYKNATRFKAFVLTLRYTALRLGDIVRLTPDRIQNGRLLLYTKKEGTAVHLLLPPVLLAALEQLKVDSGYFFWTGKGKVKSAGSAWEQVFSDVLASAGISGHPHMYRHTMATDLLSKGVSVERVAEILGNTPDIVRKHYAPWIAARQKALDECLQMIWSADEDAQTDAGPAGPKQNPPQTISESNSKGCADESASTHSNDSEESTKKAA